MQKNRRSQLPNHTLDKAHSLQVVHTVGKFMQERPDALPDNADIPNFLNLLLEMVRNESLHVSIPILHLWAQLLQPSKVGNSEVVLPMIGPLLEICSQRLLRFEALPEDANIPALIFLSEDLDTIPERHAFLGNYARFCRDVVDAIVFKRPFDALQHILNQADDVLSHLYDGESAFTVSQYKKASFPALKLDAQFSVVEAALAGYTHWRTEKYKQRDQLAIDQELEAINVALEGWCRKLFEARFEDPGILQRIIVLIAEFALNPLKRKSDFVRAVFQYLLDSKRRLLTTQLPSQGIQYNEAVKELHRFTSHQIQRVALRAADFLINDFTAIENAVSELCQMARIEEDDRDRCISVLFIIMQRASNLSHEERLARLETYVSQTVSKWNDQHFGNLLQSFDGFCNLLAFSGFQEYFTSRDAIHVEDWSALPLDGKGLELKARIDAAQRVRNLLHALFPANGHRNCHCEQLLPFSVSVSTRPSRVRNPTK